MDDLEVLFDIWVSNTIVLNNYLLLEIYSITYCNLIKYFQMEMIVKKIGKI